MLIHAMARPVKNLCASGAKPKMATRPEWIVFVSPKRATFVPFTIGKSPESEAWRYVSDLAAMGYRIDRCDGTIIVSGRRKYFLREGKRTHFRYRVFRCRGGA